MAVLAPMPRESDATATKVNSGLRRRLRRANRRSKRNLAMAYKVSTPQAQKSLQKEWDRRSVFVVFLVLDSPGGCLTGHKKRLPVLPAREIADRQILKPHIAFAARVKLQVAQKSILHELRNVAEVNVHVVHFARVDPLAGLRVGLVREPQVNASRHRERPVELRSGRSAGEHTDLKLLPAEVRIRDAVRQFNRHRLRITRAGKPAHANLVAGSNQSRRLGGAHNLPLQTGVQNACAGWGRNTHGKALTV